MRRLMVVGICMVCILACILGGCRSAQGQSGQSRYISPYVSMPQSQAPSQWTSSQLGKLTPAKDDPLLLALLERLLNGDISQIRLLTSDTLVDEEHKNVAVTREILQQVAGLLAEPELMRWESELKSISDWGHYTEIVYDGQIGEEPLYIDMRIYGPNDRDDPYAEKTLLCLEMGNTYANFIAPADFAERMHTLFVQNTYEEAGIATDREVVWIPDFEGFERAAVQLEDTLAIIDSDIDSDDEEKNTIYLYDLKTGQELPSIQIPDGLGGIEEDPFTPGLLRVYTKTNIRWYNAQGNQMDSWDLPDTIVQKTSPEPISFNIYKDKLVYAYQSKLFLCGLNGENEQEIYDYWDATSTGSASGASPIAPMNTALGSPVCHSPRFMNNGQCIVAYGAFGYPLIVDLQTGKSYYYNDLETGYSHYLSFLDDTTVVSVGIDFTQIDVRTKQTQEIPHTPMKGDVFSKDAGQSAYVAIGRDKEGNMVRSVVLWDERTQTDTVYLQTKGANLRVRALLESVILCRYDDSQKQGYLLVKYPQ